MKPLVWGALAGALWRWRGDARLRSAVLVLATIAALHKNLDIGEGLAAVALGLLLVGAHRTVAARGVALLLAIVGLRQIAGQGWNAFHLAALSPDAVNGARLATIVAALIALAYAAWRPADTDTRSADGAEDVSRDVSPLRSLAVCAGLLLATLALRGNPARLRPASRATIAAAIRLDAVPAATAGVTAWAATNSPRGSLFALPPADDRFETFRLAAGRGVYAMVGDVDQLAYDAAVYGDAHRRLLALGMRVRGRHDFDLTDYATADAARVSSWAADGVTHAILPRSAPALPFPVAYQDPAWTVYVLPSAR